MPFLVVGSTISRTYPPTGCSGSCRHIMKVVKYPISPIEQAKECERWWGSRGQYSNVKDMTRIVWGFGKPWCLLWGMIVMKLSSGSGQILLIVCFGLEGIVWKKKLEIPSGSCINQREMSIRGRWKGVCPVLLSHCRSTQWRHRCFIHITCKDFQRNKGLAPWSNAPKLLDRHSSPWPGKARSDSSEIIYYFCFSQGWPAAPERWMNNDYSHTRFCERQG